MKKPWLLVAWLLVIELLAILLLNPWRLDRQSHQKGIRAGGTESWCRSKRLDTEQSIYLVQVERY